MNALARLAAEPRHAALFFDIDGVLAPIVPRREDATVPEPVRADLRRLAAQYPLVACVTGRPLSDALEIVGVPELRYVGEHGLDLEPNAAAFAAQIARFADDTAWADTELKRHSATFHFRSVEDEEAARAALEQVAGRAREQGLRARFGRRVLEVLPPVDATKGTAVRHLLAEARLRRALYAGDDTTDLDAFSALDGLDVAVRVAIVSGESPPGLRERADLVLESPAAFAELLTRL